MRQPHLNRFKALTLAVLTFGGILPLLFASCASSRTVDSVTIGSIPHEENTLIYIAQARNFFAANGLSVSFKDYDSGPTAVAGLLNHEVDVAMASDFVLAATAFTNQTVRSFSSIAKAQIIDVIGRNDKGVKSVSDLKGKRVGLSLKTSSEFYLGRFLDLNGLNINQLTLVNLSPAQAVDAFVNGNVDAVVAWQPNVSLIQQRLPNGLVIWPAQNFQASYWNAIASQDWISLHPDLIKRFLTALSQSEAYLLKNPDQSKNIIQNKMNYSSSYVAGIWPQYQFYLSLDQSQVAAMEDEARWEITNNLTSASIIPNYPNYFYVDGLKAVDPADVNISK